MLDDKEKIKIELLIKECENVEQDIRNLFNTIQRVIAITLIILTTGLAYGISANIKEVLLILPFAFLGILLYGIFIYSTMMALGGYKRHLEEKINTALGENLLLWELFIVKKLHGHLGTVGMTYLYFLYVILFFSSAYYSLKTAYIYYISIIFWSILFILLAGFVGLCVSLSKMNKMHDEIYQISKEKSKQINE